MGEKVKVTQEQQHLIDQWMDNKVGLVNIFVDRNAHKGSILYSFTLDQLIKSLYVGYEVEPEFEVGDFITHKLTGDIGKVTKISANAVHADNTMGGAISGFRHSTESEIAQEIERIFWSKHGRDLKEYRIGDVVHDSNGDIGMVTGFKESVGYASLLVSVSGVGFCMRGELKLICPVEKRLDISHE